MTRANLRSVGLVLGWLSIAVTGAWAFEDRTPRVHALVGARVVVRPGKVLDRATVVVRDGIVISVGGGAPPADARVWDLQGRTVYAGLVEPYLDFASGKKPPPPGSAAEAPKPPPLIPSGGVRHPNPRVRAEERVAESLVLDEKELETLRAVGFASAHVVPSRGIFRGQSAVVGLRPGQLDDQMLRADVAQMVAFEHSSGDERDFGYPVSIMGSVALVRQTLLDARWAREAQQQYAAAGAGVERPETNLSIDILGAVLPPSPQTPVWMKTDDVLGTMRCTALVREFGLRAVLLGNGEEYQHVDAVRAAGLPIVLPLVFPPPPVFADDDEALDVELDLLRHWNAAPANAARLQAAGIAFALTSNGLEKRADFRRHVRRAIEAGLPEAAALAAVTTVPARLLGLEAHLGSIETGKIANFTVTDGDLFAEKTRVLEVWVDGERFEVRDDKLDAFDQVAGKWQLRSGTGGEEREWKLELQGNEWTLRGTLTDAAGHEIPVQQLRWQQGELWLRLGAATTPQTLRLRPEKKALRGTWQQPDGKATAVEGSRPEPVPGSEH